MADDVERIEAALMGFLDAYRRSRSRLQRDPGLRGLTWAQFMVLQAAALCGDQGISRIAAAAELAQPPTTRAIARLETKGLVTRRPALGDRRRTAVEVTEEGSRLLAHHRRRRRAAAHAIHDSLPPAQRKQAARVLEALGQTIDRIP